MRKSNRSSSNKQKIEKRVVPKSEIGLNVDKTFNFSTLRSFREGKEVVIKTSRAFQGAPPKELQELFVNKCRECSVICDFSASNIDMKAKQIKTQLLIQLAGSFTIPHLVRTLNPDSMKAFFKMLSINLFRPIPPIPIYNTLDAHDSLFDQAWPHISLAYKSLTASFNCQQATNMLSQGFIYKLIENGASPDERERVAVRDILHSLYTKFMPLRDIVRESISFQFAKGVCSAEILEFFVSVVTGFNSPLNPIHVMFFHKTILPLHTLNAYPAFYRPLIQCVICFISKSGILLEPTITYILQHWPRAIRQKQSLMLKEIEELLVAFEIHVTPQMAVSVFKLIGEMCVNKNSDVAETAFDILMNPACNFMLKTHSAAVYPLIVEPLYNSAKKHWDECIRTNAFVTLQTLAEIDQATFNKVNDALRLAKTKKKAQFGVFKTNWSKIFDSASAADRSIKSINLDCLK